MFKKRMNPYLNPNQDLNANPNMSSPEMNTFANPGQQMMPEDMNASQPLNQILTPKSFLQDRMYGIQRPQPVERADGGMIGRRQPMPAIFKDGMGKDMQVRGLENPQPLNPPKEPVEQISAQPVPPPTNKAPRAGTGRFGNLKRTLMPR